MSDIRTAIRDYTDKQLLTEYFHNSDEYTEEAKAIMREEIERRGLRLENPGQEAPAKESPSALHFNTEDFIQFDHSFSRTDLLIASAILRERNIPFFTDNPVSTDTLPLASESELRYTIRIHKTRDQEAHALLDEHFIKADNKYLLKYTGARERLKAFDFHDIHLSEGEAAEELDVVFSDDEKKAVVTLGRRLLAEADRIEQSQDRMLFYYDSIEPLIERLEEPGRVSLSRNDLLTMLEILQVYADDPALPQSMDEAIRQLLAFFLET